MRHALLAGLMLLAIGAAVATEPAQRTLTFEDRVAAQKAIEQVYWNHRIWPRKNPQPKPPLSAVTSDQVIRARVEDYLKKSAALEKWWQMPITGKQLQGEMDRMAVHTHDGATLQELFHALGDDPVVIAEILSRQTLADRLIRNLYATDTRFHGALKASATAALVACADPSCLKPMSGQYEETTWRKGVESVSSSDIDHFSVETLQPDEWAGHLARLAARLDSKPESIPTGSLSSLEETTDGFNVISVTAQGDDEITTARATWQKRSFNSWWDTERDTIGAVVAQPVMSIRLPDVRTSTCASDTWSPTRFGAPDPRNFHTAVWTGSQMIVWGGYNDLSLNTGGRYDPLTETWTPTSIGTAVPEARVYHTAVWTGSQMIVWGGYNNAYLNTGGRYDPATDTWTPTSTGANVPSARYRHTAVWTGSEMIVWGGGNGPYLNSGGRYDPLTDTWAPTSTNANVPSVRGYHTSVWTGTKMIVWGGYNNSYLNTGGRYDPSTDTWTPTSMGANVPTTRYVHTAAWTGSQMIVWGGYNGSFTNAGGRYTPSTDTWSPTSIGANVPSARGDHTAVWSGSQMIVWGGSNASYLNTGGRYDPSTDAWTPSSMAANVPSGRSGHTALWTGSQMVVWGGYDSTTNRNTGGRYDPSTDSWTTTSPGASVPSARGYQSAIWTGTEMIVWGGKDGSYLNTGGRYAPATDTWTPTSTGANVPSARRDHRALWTGTRMIVWGGYNGLYLNTGGRYDPSTDTWAPVSTGANVPSARNGQGAVWNGSQLFVWGGYNGSYLNTGGRYDPSADTWTPISGGANAPSARADHTSVWTGSRMLVWGGYNGSYLNTGGRYDPSSDSWTSTSTGASVPSARTVHTAVWTGSQMIVWGGYNGSHLNTGGRYDPSSDTWTSTSTGASVPSARTVHTVVWTGLQMIVWGGYGGSNTSYLNTGGRYEPLTDTWTPTAIDANVPSARANHTAVWTETEMIVWGASFSTDSGGIYCACPNGGTVYRDADGDGDGDPAIFAPSCDGTVPAGYVSNASDCNDSNPTVYPGAPEINDGINNQCPGDPGYGMVDELGNSGSVAADKVTFSWPVQPMATSYALARASTPDFTIACTSFGASSPSFLDPESPTPRTAFYYIARAAAPFVGSWGRTSSGIERTTSCP